MGTNTRTVKRTKNGTDGEIGTNKSKKRTRKFCKKDKDQESEAGTNTRMDGNKNRAGEEIGTKEHGRRLDGYKYKDCDGNKFRAGERSR